MRYYRRRRGVAKKSAKKTYKRKSVPKKIRTYVKRAINREVENKRFMSYAANTAITTASTSTPTNVQLLPTLAYGAGEQQRIGNRVKIVKGVIHGYVNILPYSATLNPLSTPIMVKMWLLSGRQRNSNTFSNYDPANNFFETGTSQVGPQGNMLDMVLAVNSQEYIVHASKTFRIGAGYASGTGPVGTGGYFDNSPMNKYFRFNWGAKCKSQLVYNDQVTNIATNKNMFLVIQAVNADGSTTSVNPAEFHFKNEVLYQDA